MGRLTPDELVERADAIGRLGALDAQGFFGGRISEGHAVRVVFRKGRRFDDLVLFQRDEGGLSGVGAPPGGEFRVLSSWNFPILSEWGPVVVQDRVIPTAFDDADGWVRSVMGSIEGLRLGPRLLRRHALWAAYATTARGTVREFLGCVAQGSIEAAREEVIAHLRSLLRNDEVLHPDVVVAWARIDGVANGNPLAGVTRRSRLSIDEYAQRY